MTTKTAGKPVTPAETKTEPAGHDLDTLYQIHTLAQLVYGSLATTHPWVASPMSGYPQTGGWQATAWPQAWPGFASPPTGWPH